jgi:hypothetical protein
MTVQATPNTPNQNSSTSSNATKIATPEYVQIKEADVSPELMAELLFEDIGGQEIINIARSDLINGQPVVYQPIKNINNLSVKYSSQNILGLKSTLENTFKNFTLKLERYVPEVGTGPDGKIVYIDPDTGNLVVNTINTVNEMQVEIQVFSDGDLFDDTIYGDSL